MSILYGDFKKLIKDSFIKDNDKSDTIDNIRQILEGTTWSKEDIYKEVWQHFLTFLRNEGTDLDNNGLPITKNLWTQENKSLFEYLNEQIDLPDSLYTTLRGILSDSISSDTENTNTTTTSTFWNESVSNLIDYYLRNLTPRGIDLGNGKTITWQITSDDQTTTYSANLKQIRNSDAGKDFNNEYVNPTNNTVGESYKNVRGSDFILKDAQDSQNLKYTNPAGVPNAMRLLMPDYQRQVKVEDLNRNFWVISQCIAGICAYLFEEESPINNIIERTLNEIVQLWENLLYLWAIFAISVANKRKQYTDVHCEIVPLSISKDYNFRKYDNFDDYEGIYDNENKVNLGALKNLILTNIKYLEDTYPESNLCIVPFMRMGNYEHNYYNEEWYPGVAIFDRNKKEQEGGGWTFNYFETTYAPSIKTVSSVRYGLKLSTNYASPINDDTLVIYNFLLNAWGITKSKDGVMKAHYPAYTISEYEEWDNDTYYAVGRCLPSSFTAQYNTTTGEVEFGGITFKLEDGIGQGLKSWAKNMSVEEYDSRPFEEKNIIQDLKNSPKGIFNISIVFNSNYKEKTLSGSGGMYVNPNPERIEYEKNLTKITPFGYYMGELMSDIKESKQFYPTIHSSSVYGRPLITDIGEIKQDNDKRYTSKNLFSSDSIFQELKESDYEVLQNYINNKLNSTSNNLELYNLTHQYGIYADQNIRRIEPYYIYENNKLEEINTNGDDRNPKQVIKGTDTVFSFDNERNFIKKNASAELLYQKNSDIIASSGGYYGSRRGTLSVCSVLWVPFVQGFYYLRNFLQYNRINMCPDVQHEPVYHKTYNNIDTNIVQIEEYKKNEAYYPLRHLLHTIKKFDLNINYPEEVLYYADTYTVTELVLFDKTGKVSEDNWGIKYTTATYNYNCILDTPEINSQTGKETFKTYYKFTGSTGQGVQDLLGFHPLKINSQNYENLKNQKNHDAYLLFNMIKKKVVDCYYENPDNLYEAPFYQIFFKKDGKIDSNLNSTYTKEFMSEFNIWIILANIDTVETYDTKISWKKLNNIAESAGRTGYNCTLRDYLSELKEDKTFAEIYNMTDGTYTVPNNYEHGSCWKTFIGHSYISSVSTILIFPNGQQVVKRINTQDPDGHNTEYSSTFDDIAAYDGLNTSLDLVDYLPGFYYDNSKTASINWSNLYNEWLLRSNLLYSQTSDNAAKYTIDSSNKKLLSTFLREKNLKALNFTKYPNNGRRTI